MDMWMWVLGSSCQMDRGQVSNGFFAHLVHPTLPFSIIRSYFAAGGFKIYFGIPFPALGSQNCQSQFLCGLRTVQKP